MKKIKEERGVKHVSSLRGSLERFQTHKIPVKNTKKKERKRSKCYKKERYMGVKNTTIHHTLTFIYFFEKEKRRNTTAYSEARYSLLS